MRDSMTPKQLAHFLHLTTHTVYRLIHQQKLAASKSGRRYLIPSDEVERFLKAHSTRSQVRRTLFRRVLAVAERNPSVNSDQVLNELEALDATR
jgi:excisionase family DNA binding protein